MIRAGALLLLAAFSFTSTEAFALTGAWDGRIWDLRAEKVRELTPDTLARELRPFTTVVLAEKHDTPAVQRAQAYVLGRAVELSGDAHAFTTAWEFLNFTDQEKVKSAFSDFVSRTINGADLMERLFGGPHYHSYLPIMNRTRELGGELVGVNLPRSLKAHVVREGWDGLKKIPAGLVPGDFSLVQAPGYKERFVEAMGGHGDPATVERYFIAQCLTDDVIAERLMRESANKRHFLVIGSFHAAYGDGVVAKLALRAPGERVANVRFVDASDYTEDGLRKLVSHPEYGRVGDFVVFVNEPTFRKKAAKPLFVKLNRF